MDRAGAHDGEVDVATPRGVVQTLPHARGVGGVEEKRVKYLIFLFFIAGEEPLLDKEEMWKEKDSPEVPPNQPSFSQSFHFLFHSS